jgi:hypothetical protein
MLQARGRGPALHVRHGTQFTCFTSTKGQILAQKAMAGRILMRGAQLRPTALVLNLLALLVQLVLTQRWQVEFSCGELSFDQLHLQRGLSRWRGELRSVSGSVPAVEWISRLYRLCSRQVSSCLSNTLRGCY